MVGKIGSSLSQSTLKRNLEQSNVILNEIRIQCEKYIRFTYIFLRGDYSRSMHEREILALEYICTQLSEYNKEISSRIKLLVNEVSNQKLKSDRLNEIIDYECDSIEEIISNLIDAFSNLITYDEFF